MQVYAHHVRTRKQGRRSPDPANWPELVAVWLKKLNVGLEGLSSDEVKLYEEHCRVVVERERRGREFGARLAHQKAERTLEHKLTCLLNSRILGARRKPTGV